MHAFFDSGAFRRYSALYGEAPNPFEALDELARQPQWDLRRAAKTVRGRAEAATAKALAALAALPGDEEARLRARWTRAPARIVPGCAFLLEAELRLAGQITASGMTGRVAGRLQAATPAWHRLTADPELRQ
jgi:hypothetical protein